MATQEVEAKGKDEDGYGPWMVVSRSKIRPRRTKPEDPTKSNQYGPSSLVRPNRLMMEKLEAQTLLSDSRHKSNMQNGGPEKNKEKTMEKNTAGKLEEGKEVNPNVNTCMVVKA